MSFNNFQFHPAIHANIKACGFVTPTPIQKKSIQPMLDGNDILGLAQTGTGKTAAFVLPMLQLLQKGPRKRVRALIMAPTRELAEQIHVNITALGKQTGLRSVVVYGGVGKQPQLSALRSGVEIVVACPGRLLDLLGEKGVSLANLEILVLDEADHMFDKGFLPDMRKIIKQIPQKRQTCIFSATMPEEINRLTREVLRDPVRIQINHTKPAPTIGHSLYSVEKADKTRLLQKLIQQEKMTSSLVFTRTKHKAKSLALVLQRKGFKAISMQGNLSQQKRHQALEGFRNGSYTIMVATDIAARGIDVDGITHVINYDVPETVETYTHRTGRTGRAQKKGEAITFASQDDRKQILAIERKLGKTMKRSQTAVATDTASKHAAQQNAHLPYHENKRNGSKPNRYSKRKRSRAHAFDFGLKPQAVKTI